MFLKRSNFVVLDRLRHAILLNLERLCPSEAPFYVFVKLEMMRVNGFRSGKVIFVPFRWLL